MSKLRTPYVAAISLAGLLLVIWGLVQFPTYDQPSIFILLVALAIVAQLASTSAEVTFEVSTAISLATVPLYGPAAAAVVAAAAHAGLWLMNLRKERSQWKGSWEQLGFNAGMSSIAVFVAGLIFLTTANLLGTDTLLGQTVPWLVAAIIGDQINIWLLIIILVIQHRVRPLAFWRDNRWAMPINVMVMGVGGGLLAASVYSFDILGVAIFFLPIFLSAYAFRLFVIRTQQQMDKLEELIAERTQELVAANQELSNLHREKDAFLALLTHDMRSPLTSIHGYAMLLRDHSDLPEAQRANMAQIIIRSQESLLEIVNNILEIERLQSGAPVLLERENFDLVELVGEIVEVSGSQAGEKQIGLVHEPTTNPTYINADHHKIRRVLQNLVSNAIKYTPENGSIQITTGMNGRFAFVNVEDNGYGIPADELPHIFDRFRRVDKHKHIAVGTGLGLAIVKSLVEAHDGELLVESAEGVGSTFMVRLPA